MKIERMESTLQRIFNKQNQVIPEKKETYSPIVIQIDQMNVYKVGFHMDPYVKGKKTKKEVIDKLKGIIPHCGVRPRIGRNECCICFLKLPINDYFIDGIVFKKGYMHYLEVHDYPIDPCLEKFIMEFDFVKKHNRVHSDHFPSNIKEF
jgi:hypothetical protein